jgi:nucleoside-diphosphate-sugar epimerase
MSKKDMPLKVKLVAFLPRTPLENLLYIRYEYVTHAMIENNIIEAKKLLDWTPKISFEKGIEKTINYYKENEIRSKKS